MKNSVKKTLAACLFVGVLGSSSVVLGNAANYQYVLSSSDNEEDSEGTFFDKVVNLGRLIFLVFFVAGISIDVCEHGGFKGSKTEEFVGKADELAGKAGELAYFVPKEYIAGKVLPKINENEKFKETREYLSTNSGKANFVREMKGLCGVMRELTLYVCGAIKDFFSEKR